MNEIFHKRATPLLVALKGAQSPEVSRDGSDFVPASNSISMSGQGITFVWLTEDETDAELIVVVSVRDAVAIRTEQGPVKESDTVAEEEKASPKVMEPKLSVGMPLSSPGLSAEQIEGRHVQMLERTNPQKANLYKGRKIRQQNIERGKQIKETRLKNLAKARKVKRGKA